MARVVETVVPDFGDAVCWEKVVTKDLQGALRYGKLSKRLGRPAPVPSIFIEENLAFETTPGPEELKAYIERYLAKKTG